MSISGHLHVPVALPQR